MKVTGNYIHPNPPTPTHPPPLSISLYLLILLLPSLLLHFPSRYPPPINHSLLLLLLTPSIPLFSYFSLIDFLPTPLPLFLSLSSIRHRQRHIVWGVGSSSPFSLTPRQKDLLGRRGGKGYGYALLPYPVTYPPTTSLEALPTPPSEEMLVYTLL